MWWILAKRCENGCSGAPVARGLRWVSLCCLACSGAATSGPSGAPGDGAAASDPGQASSTALPSAGCEGVARRKGPPTIAGNGRLRLELTQAAASGLHYRLRGATFSLSRFAGDVGLGVTIPEQLTTAESLDPDALEVALPAGEYALTLADGWSIVQLGEGEATPVNAGRLSPATRYFQLDGGADVTLRFRFEVEVPGVELTPPALAPTLGILERPSPPSGRVCVESLIVPEEFAVFSADTLRVLDGCGEIRGDLYLGLDSALSLAPLSQLKEVCGVLSIASTAPLLPDSSPAAQSLVGLEALEGVDALFISHGGVGSLAPLARLRRIQRPDVENDALGLFAMQSNLEDLTGLEQVTEIRNIRVDGGEHLRSLRGLTLPSEMDSVQIEGTHLADLSALAGVTRLSGDFGVNAGALETLDDLSNLRSAASVSVYGGRVRDATGLAGLETTGYLAVIASPLEVELPVFEKLTQVGDLNFSELPVSGGLSLPVLASAANIFIANNSNLASVSAPALTSVGRLSISGNPMLASLDFAALSTASVVGIIHNPLLGEDALAGLSTLETTLTKIGANAGGSTPLDPCPFAGDFECDEPGGTGLCAPATDGADCGPID
jgi:hypothetical protein